MTDEQANKLMQKLDAIATALDRLSTTMTALTTTVVERMPKPGEQRK